MQTWQWYQSLHQKVMSAPSCNILHYIWGQQFSCVILYAGEKDRRSLLTHTHTHTHTHTFPTPLGEQTKGKGREVEQRVTGQNTHTELQIDWNTYAKSGRGGQMCTYAHTHTLIQKSIFKPIARLFRPHGADREICTQTSSLVFLIIDRYQVWSLRSGGGRVRGQPQCPSREQMNQLYANHSDHITSSSPLYLLLHTACLLYCRKFECLVPRGYSIGMHHIIQIMCLQAKEVPTRIKWEWNEFVLFFKIVERFGVVCLEVYAKALKASMLTLSLHSNIWSRLDPSHNKVLACSREGIKLSFLNLYCLKNVWFICQVWKNGVLRPNLGSGWRCLSP